MTIYSYLTRLSEAGDGATLTGAAAGPYRSPTFDRLLRQGVLVEQASLREWDVCDRCDCGLASRPVCQCGGRYVAACPLDPRADQILDETDLQQFRIVPDELAAAIGKLAGFQSRPSQLTAGVWLLGELSSGRIVMLAFERHRLETDGFVQIIRSAAKGRPTTMLAPELPPVLSRRFGDADIHLITLAAAIKSNSATGNVGLDTSLLVPTAEDAELVINVATGEVIWRDHSVVLSRQLFPVFLELAEKLQAGNPIVPAARFEIATGRDGRDLIRELRDSFVRAGMSRDEVKELIVTVTGRGYRLGLGPGTILLRRSS